jgi:DNA-binding NarL/FixJ family response regulator
LIADNVPNVQVGLRVLLEQQPGFEVVGEVAGAGDLLDAVEMACPDLLLLGWELPGLAGVDSLSALRKTCPNLLVIVLSGRAEARRAALAAGADAFVSKVAPPERLLAAILSIKRIERRNDLLAESKNSPDANNENREKTEIRRLMMSELSTQASVGSKGKRGNATIIVVSVSAAVVVLACVAAFIVTVILVLDAIPFHHIFPH